MGFSPFSLFSERIGFMYRSHTSLSRSFSAALGAAALALLTLAAPPPATAQAKTYVAVGDSLAYGFMNFTSTPVGTTGFAGYAQPYDVFLSAQAGAPVALVNLGIVGETTDSLLHNGGENDDLNSHYSETTSQYDLLSTYLNTNVQNITVQVGANDLLGLATTAAFKSAVATGNTSAEQALLNGTLANVTANYDTLLARINALAPGADVQVVGYYSPYAGLPVTDLASGYLHAISDPLTQSLNAVLQAEAAKHGAQYVDLYVDLYAPFHGRESTLLLNGDLLDTPFGPLPNDHPTDAGYAVITRQLEAAPVPEASPAVSLGLLLALGLGVVAAARRKKAKTASASSQR